MNNPFGHLNTTSIVKMPAATHLDLLEEVELARSTHTEASYSARSNHCDDLRSTLIRHYPYLDSFHPEQPVKEYCYMCIEEWPCPDTIQVIDRLNVWEAQLGYE